MPLGLLPCDESLTAAAQPAWPVIACRFEAVYVGNTKNPEVDMLLNVALPFESITSMIVSEPTLSPAFTLNFFSVEGMLLILPNLLATKRNAPHEAFRRSSI